MASDNPVITIDGPAASGKGTLATRLSKKFGFHILDSGLLYRIAAFVATQDGISMSDGDAIAELLDERVQFWVNEQPDRSANLDSYRVYIHKSFEQPAYVTVNDHNLSATLRNEHFSKSASIVAEEPQVREKLIPIQRSFSQPPGLVADGRDMGSVVFQDAQVKIFLEAPANIRARRRYEQLLSAGESPNLADIEDELVRRDERDRTRTVAPLVKAADAKVIDTTELSIEATVKVAGEYVEQKLSGLSSR